MLAAAIALGASAAEPLAKLADDMIRPFAGASR
jgi:hypothetical protein